MTRLALLAPLLLLASCSHDAPVAQPRLAEMKLAAFKEQFNAAPGARVVSESDRRAPLELPLPLGSERRYGDTMVTVFKA